jgi:hypothetical protein
MTITATSIIETIGQQLHDTGESIWTAAIICKYASEAQKLIALMRPDATAKADTFALAVAVKQTLPSDGARLLDLPMNTGGAPIRKIDRAALSDSVPGWTTEEGSAVEFFMFDMETPKQFYVYPRPATAFNVDIVYSSIPTDIATDATSISISDTYLTPLLEWTMYRCLSMESEGFDMAAANSHLNNFFNVLGIKQKNEALLYQVQETT